MMIGRVADTPILQPIRVLLVDNNPHIRRLLRTVLERCGSRSIHEAQDGREALRHLMTKPVDLLISGWHMTPMDGLELARHIRLGKDSPVPDLPIVMMAGAAEREAATLARQAGVSLLLERPLFAHKLIAAACQVLGLADGDLAPNH